MQYLKAECQGGFIHEGMRVKGGRGWGEIPLVCHTSKYIELFSDPKAFLIV